MYRLHIRRVDRCDRQTDGRQQPVCGNRGPEDDAGADAPDEYPDMHDTSHAQERRVYCRRDTAGQSRRRGGPREMAKVLRAGWGRKGNGEPVGMRYCQYGDSTGAGGWRSHVHGRSENADGLNQRGQHTGVAFILSPAPAVVRPEGLVAAIVHRAPDVRAMRTGAVSGAGTR